MSRFQWRQPDDRPAPSGLAPRHKTTGPEGPVRLWWQKLLNGVFKSNKDLMQAVQEERSAMDAERYSVERFKGEYSDPIKSVLPQRLVAPSIMSDTSMLRRHNVANWAYMDQSLMVWSARFIEEGRKRGIPLYVHSAFRTKAEQEELFKKGSTFTRWPAAAHCQGKAVDIVHGSLHWQMTPAEWSYLFELGQEALRLHNAKRPKERWLKLRWGGDWDGDGDIHDQRLYDPAHWEVHGWQTSILKLPDTEPVRFTPRAILARFD